MPGGLSLPLPLFVAPLGNVGVESERCLLQAFRSFAEAADSLERSYGLLSSEVARLRGELEQSHAGLERSLEENRRIRLHLDRILEGLPCGVLVAKMNGEILLANPEAQRLLEWHGKQKEEQKEASEKDSEAAAAKTAAKTKTKIKDELGGSLAGLGPALCALLSRAQSSPEEQESFVPSAHGRRWLAARHARLNPGESASGEAVSVFILRDVSEAKRMAQQRDQQRREQALAEMSAILAHEIRNPLGSLELFAGLLAEAKLGCAAERWVAQVQAGLRTLSATVNNVLHFYSLPAPECVAADLGLLLDWAREFLLPIARQAGVDFSVCHDLFGVEAAADRHQLEQVLLNLVLNAVRAMPEGGRVEVSGRSIAGADARSAVISVSDTGPGIAAEDFERIFEAGYSTRASGPGLGLTVCRKVIAQHGGSLTAANRSGAGAVFVVTLPATGRPDPNPRPKAEEKCSEC